MKVYISSYNFSNHTVFSEVNHIFFNAVMFLSCPCLPSITISLQMQNRNETDDFAKAAGCCCDAVCMLRDWPCARLSAVTIVLIEILQVCANERECKYIYIY